MDFGIRGILLYVIHSSKFDTASKIYVCVILPSKYL